MAGLRRAFLWGEGQCRIGGLSSGLASRVLGRQIDDGRHRATVDSFLAELEQGQTKNAEGVR